MNCKGKNSLGPGSLVGKKWHKMGWKGVQKQLASDWSEPSGGTRERERPPYLSPPSHPVGSLGLLIFFCAFHPVFCFLYHQGAWSEARGRIKQKGDRSNLCSGKKKSSKKIQAYTGFKYFIYAIRVLHQYQSVVQILYEPELFQAFFCCICTCKDLLCI